MAYESFGNIILALTASHRLCLHLVWFYFLFTRELIFYSNAVLHPYYKLDYIKLKWGGEKEQAEERAQGNLDAKNWQDEARKIIEATVSIPSMWKHRDLI